VAQKALASDLRTGKRRTATLVWVLEDAMHGTIDCLAIKDGREGVHLCVERAGAQEDWGAFPDARAAVRRAFALERSLMSQGWEKVV
jgi:hypothetical protein